MRIKIEQEALGIVTVSKATKMMTFVSKAEKAAGREAEQEKTADGKLRWELHCPVVSDESGFVESEVLAVRVATAPDAPGPEVGTFGSPIFLGGLTMNVLHRNSGDGKGFTVSFAADTFSFEMPPSARNGTTAATTSAVGGSKAPKKAAA